jgi:hypothetical protein
LPIDALFEGRPEGQKKEWQENEAAFVSASWHNMMDFTIGMAGRRERKRKGWI